MHQQDRTASLEVALQRENASSLRNLVRMFVYVVNSAKVMCAIFISLLVLLSLLRPALAYLWGRYIDLAAAYPHSGEALPGEQVLPMVLLVTAYFLIGFLSDLIYRYTHESEDIERLDKVQMNRLQERLNTRIYAKIARLSSECMEVPKINDTIKQVFDYTQNGWDGMNREIMVNGYMIFAKAISVVTITLSLWIFHPSLALIVLIVPIPTLYTTYIGNKLWFKLIKENSELMRQANYYENLMLGQTAKEIKALGLHSFFYEKWRTLSDKYTAEEKRTQVRSALLNTVSTAISTLVSVGVNVFAIYLMVDGRISIGALGAVISLTGTLIADTSRLFRAVATFIAKKNEATAFFDLVDLPEQPTEGAALSEIAEIEAQGLRYRYPLTDRYVLDGVDLTIGSGEKVAFVGENGAGKTTFVKLISGMLAPSGGDLRINGLPVETIKSEKHYSAMSAVFQNPAQYQTFTIADNVWLGDPARGRERGNGAPRDNEAILTSLAAAGLENVKPDTLLGKDIGGTDLSGGQWQKLAVARATYRDRDFIILDEPTSNLDPLAEADIFRRYIEMARERTVIMVTHRISIAALCDRIVVFSNGQIVEDGTHAALLAAGGEYARLHTEQSQWYDR
jgi:ATP-binding cassette, subfamily B, bacterial